MRELIPDAAVRIRFNNTPTVYRCEAGWSWNPAPLPDCDLWCVLDGRGEMIIADRRHELRAGSCFAFAPGDSPRATQDIARRLVVFAVHFDWIDARDRIIEASRLPFTVVAEFALLQLLARRCTAVFSRGGAGAQESLLCARLILNLLDADLVEPSKARLDERLRELLTTIREEPGRRWKIEQMARRVCLSRAQFSRKFQAATGHSPNRFLIEARLERAQQLLLETTMPLGQIAAMLGYTDVTFFSRQFKQFRGISPGELRR